MFRVDYKKNGIRIGAVWYADHLEIPKGVDIAYFHQLTQEAFENGYAVKPFNTICLDLGKEESELFGGFRKDMRRNIRLAEKSDIEIEIFSAQVLVESPDIFNELESVYNAFLQTKNMKGRFNRTLAVKYAMNGNLTASVVRLDGEIHVLHIYIGDASIVRLWYSASLYRTGREKGSRSFWGRANHLLHWKDILYFKSMGVKTYDLGGIGASSEFSGINSFKEGFGGKNAEFFNLIYPVTARGRIALGIQALVDRLRG